MKRGELGSGVGAGAAARRENENGLVFAMGSSRHDKPFALPDHATEIRILLP